MSEHSNNVSMDTLSDNDLADLLKRYEGWELKLEPKGLVKTFKFKNFVETFGWMARVSLYAEKINHHPDWHNVYNMVKVVLITHDVDAITQLDADLLRAMERLAA